MLNDIVSSMSSGLIHSNGLPVTLQVNTTFSPGQTGEYEGEVC